MRKRFKELKDGDDVYIIRGNSVEIVKAEDVIVAKCSVFFKLGDTEYFPLKNTTSLSIYKVGDIHKVGDVYCDVHEAWREMKKRYNANIIECKKSHDSLLLLEECIPRYHKN